METSPELRNAAERWRAAADQLIATAERAGPLEPDVFGDALFEEDASAEALLREQVRTLLATSDEIVNAAGDFAETDEDARARAAAVLFGNLEVSGALLTTTDAPDVVFGELGLEPSDTLQLIEARTTVAEFESVIVGTPGVAGAQVTLPTSLTEKLEDLETKGADEAIALSKASATAVAGSALVSGLNGVLRGSAAAAFNALQDALGGIRNMIKRGVVRIANWIVDRIRKLLPAPFQSKLDVAIDAVKDKVAAGVPRVVGDAVGAVLGRGECEDAWREAVGAGRDLSKAESALATATDPHVKRLGWVTKARGHVEKFDGKIMQTVVATLPPPAQLAFFALVAAVFAFAFLQVWDGFNDVEALVRR